MRGPVPRVKDLNFSHEVTFNQECLGGQSPASFISLSCSLGHSRSQWVLRGERLDELRDHGLGVGGNMLFFFLALGPWLVLPVSRLFQLS